MTVKIKIFNPAEYIIENMFKNSNTITKKDFFAKEFKGIDTLTLEFSTQNINFF